MISTCLPVRYMSLLELHLKLDHFDWEAIEEAMVRRLSWGTMPDARHDDATMTGRLLAEICRGWMELHDQLDAQG